MSKVIDMTTKLNWSSRLVGLDRSRVQHIVVHNTGAEVGTVEGIHNYHKGLKWGGIGYNELIYKNGTTYIARGMNVGAQVANNNSATYGIACLGNYDVVSPVPAAQWNALKERIKEVRKAFPNLISVSPHKRFGAGGGGTTCPGNKFPFDKLLDELYRETGDNVYMEYHGRYSQMGSGGTRVAPGNNVPKTNNNQYSTGYDPYKTSTVPAGVVYPPSYYAANSVSQGNNNHGDVSYAGSNRLLNPSPKEREYGISVFTKDQPLIKFSTSKGVDASDERQALKKYSEFMYGFMNSNVETATLNLLPMPWIRPGVNIWVDPLNIDSVYYVNSVSHSGSASEVGTTLELVMGRDRIDFQSNKCEFGGMTPGKSDNIFTNVISKGVETFGPCINNASEFEKIRSSVMARYQNQNPTMEEAMGNPYMLNFYNVSDFKEVQQKKTFKTDEKLSTIIWIKPEQWKVPMKQGDSSAHVQQLQKVLKYMGYFDEKSHSSNFYGDKTLAAMLSYQSRKGIKQTGIFDDLTRQFLLKDFKEITQAHYSAYSAHMEYDNVQDIQDHLNKLYSTAPPVVKKRVGIIKNCVAKTEEYIQKVYESNFNKGGV